jgi:hypothetical protein
MRRPLSITIVFFAALALLFAGPVACSDDGSGGGGGESQDTGITEDVSGGAEDTDTPDANTNTPDAGEDTSSEPNDAGTDAADSSGGSDVADTGGGEDTGSATAGHSGCTHPAQDDAGCAAEDFGDHGPGTFLNEFRIEGGGVCCRDFDGDQTVDSALGDLIGSISGILQINDFNEDIIAPQVASGDIVFLFEYAYWSDPVEDPALEFNLMFGQDTDADFAPNMAGTGDFLINPTSLDSNGDPKSSFPSASVSNGHLRVPSGSAPLVLPVGTDLVETRVDDLRIDADVVGGTADLHTSGRVELTDGEISGVVTLEQMFSSLNTVAASCGCFSTTAVFVESSPDSWTCEATQADKTACSGVSSMCETLSTPTGDGFVNCGSIANLISDAADVNLDDDAPEEALSLGATFNGVGASIVGVGTAP